MMIWPCCFGPVVKQHIVVRKCVVEQWCISYGGHVASKEEEERPVYKYLLEGDMFNDLASFH